MNPGGMDRRVVIENYATSTDDWGHPVRTWSTLASVWAQKKDVQAIERTEQAQIVALTYTQFRIRYRSDVDTTMRISYGNTYFYITGVKELGRREGLEIRTELRD